MSAMSLNLAIFAILSGVALIEYGLRETRARSADAANHPDLSVSQQAIASVESRHM
jgi:hypothetical protein